VMTTFGSFTGTSRFQRALELDCGLAHRDSHDQQEDHRKVIEFYVPKRFRKAFVRADQAQPGKVIDFLFVGKGASPDSTFWRGHCVAPVRHSVQPCCR
jgi:hypothetical protein